MAASAVSTTNRITGMFSGLDTDALVKAMTMNQQNKINQIYRNKTRAEWKKESYTNLNNNLRIFQDNFGSVLGANSLTKKSSFVQNKVTIDPNSSVRVTADASAKQGGYSIKVDQVATAAVATGDRVSETGKHLSTADLKTSVSNQTNFAAGPYTSPDGRIRFSVNGVDFDLGVSSTIQEIMDEVNRSSAGVTMEYSQMTDRFTITANESGAFKNLVNPGDVAPTTEPEKQAYTEAKAAYNADQKRNVTFVDSTGFLASLGINGVAAGQDAVVYVNGENEARTLSANTLALDGLTFTFLHDTEGKTLNFDVASDYSPAAGNVKTFIETLNGLLKDIHTQLNTRPDKQFYPLQDSEKEELGLSDEQAKKWEEEAKKGLLKGDRALERLGSQLRSLLSSSFGGKSLASIGITTSGYTPGSPVQLVFDEDKFNAAMKEDPDKVYDMIGKVAVTGKDKGGFVAQIGSAISTFTSETKSYQIQNLTNNINAFAKNLRTQQDRLTEMSERYYLQYAKLETALSSMQTQQDALAGMFG